jgi:hypothetical protein
VFLVAQAARLCSPDRPIAQHKYTHTMLFRKKTTPHQDFWTWFQKSRFLSTDGRQVIEKLAKRAKAIHDNIVFEIGPAGQRPRELIISADGIRVAVEHVEALADAAPPMEDWIITRFRPRLARFQDMQLNYAEVTAKAENMRFVARRVDALVDLAIFADWYNDPRRQPDGPAFIMLDMALGEYDVMCRAGHIEMHPLAEAPDDAQPWAELRDTFDRLSDQ